MNFPLPCLLSVGRTYLQIGNMWFLGKCPIVPSRLKLVEVSALGRKDPF
jgi:hypothetical protein